MDPTGGGLGAVNVTGPIGGIYGSPTGQTVSLPAGNYTITAWNTSSGVAVFDHWAAGPPPNAPQGTVGISIGDVASPSTTLTVSADGTLTIMLQAVTGNPSITVTPATVAQGQAIAIIGHNFPPNLQLIVKSETGITTYGDPYAGGWYWGSPQLGYEPRSDADGNLTFTGVTIPFVVLPGQRFITVLFNPGTAPPGWNKLTEARASITVTSGSQAGGPVIAVSPTTMGYGQFFQVSAVGFTPNKNHSICVTGDDIIPVWCYSTGVTADANGKITMLATIASWWTPPGTAQIYAVDSVTGLYSNRVSITVQPWSGDATKLPRVILFRTSDHVSKISINLQANPGWQTVSDGAYFVIDQTAPSSNVISLNPAPATGATFTGWTVRGAATISGGVVTLTRLGNAEVTAIYSPPVIDITIHIENETGQPIAGLPVTLT